MAKDFFEYRSFNAEIRADESEAMTVRGTGMVFDDLSKPIHEPVYGSFYEVIRAESVTKTLSEFDQVALWQHDKAKPLGRKSRGTLRLEKTDRGIDFWMLLPDNSWGRDAYVSIKRGDVSGMSFGFNVLQERGAGRHNGLPIREVLEMRLIELSPVTFGAYKSTNVRQEDIGAILESIERDLVPPIDEQLTEAPVIHAPAGMNRELARRWLELATT